MNEKLEHSAAVPRPSFGSGKVTFVDRFGTWLSRRAILGSLGGRSDLTVLELGCGYRAANLMAIADRARRLVGVDFNVSPEARSAPGFVAIEEPIESALESLRGQRFDLIMIISVLEHLADPLATLRRCREMLAPGGVLLVNVPTWRGKFFLELSAFRLGLSPREEMDDHKMYYDKRDLWPLVVRAGFLPSAIRLRYHKFGLNLWGEMRASP